MLLIWCKVFLNHLVRILLGTKCMPTLIKVRPATKTATTLLKSIRVLGTQVG